MIPLVFGLAALVAGLSMYHILPAVYSRVNPRLNCLRHPGRAASVKWPSGKSPWIDKVSDRLHLAGYTDPKAPLMFLVFMICPAPLLGLLGQLIGLRGQVMFLMGLVVSSFVNASVNRKIRSREKAFIKALYKIYRFLGQQLASGIRMTDALKGLPEAVDDPAVQPALVRFAARFELTLDIDQAFVEIEQSFKTKETLILKSHLAQCVQTGTAGRSLSRMEDLLFSRCFTLMQADSNKIRLHLLMASILGIIPIVALFLFPLFKQALGAMQTVFG